jgi:hypothetical protein
MSSLTNKDDRHPMTDAAPAHDLDYTFAAHWDSTVHEDLGDTMPMDAIDEATAVTG